MSGLEEALSWSGSEVTLSMYVVAHHLHGGTVELPPLDHPPSRVRSYELVDETGVLGGRRLDEHDLEWEQLPGHLAEIVSMCMAAAIERGATLVWFCFEGSFDFEHLLRPDVADQIYAVGSSGGLDLALDDDIRSSLPWEQRLAQHRRVLDIRPTGSSGVPAAGPEGAVTYIATPFDHLLARGLLDWPTLRVGRRYGWVRNKEAVDFAVAAVVAHAQEEREEVLHLAGADGEPSDVIDELIRVIAGGAGGATPSPSAHDGDDVVDAPEEAPLVRRWLWARLVVLLEGTTPADLEARADEHWAALGYPEELRAMSSWSEPAPGEAYDPLVMLRRAIAALEAGIA